MAERGAIRSPEAYLKAAIRRRTERFDSCFPRGISLGDIDSFVEIKNHFLFIEWKVAHQTILRGQELALLRLSKLPGVCVWALWTTEDGFITHGRRFGIHSARVPTNEDGVRQRIAEWVKNAETDHVIGKQLGGVA